MKLLIENQGERFSIRKISQARKINYKSAYNAVKRLEEEGVVSLEKTGNTTICSFNRRFNESVFAVEYGRREELFRNKDFKVIHNRLSRLNVPFVAVLFGSYAKGSPRKHSDIDLLVITEDINLIQQQISLLPMDIHMVDVSYSDFGAMFKSKEPTVVSEAIQKNIILVGIEEYYRLINNVG
ncbi:MAG: nucleotidyltransferase domain-containing protein [Candidatus Woesearchaeota archaeon]